MPNVGAVDPPGICPTCRRLKSWCAGALPGTSCRCSDPAPALSAGTIGQGLEGLPLFAAAPDIPAFLLAPLSRIERDFQRFHALNPHVYRELEMMALLAFSRGVPRIGIAALAETLRYNSAIATRGDGHKINNNFRALYARLLIHRHPEVEPMLELRERREKSDDDAGVAA